MNLEETSSYRNVVFLSIAVIFVMLIMSGYSWSQIQGDAGEWNAIAWDFLAVFAVPILIALTGGLLYLFVRSEPRRLHLAQSQNALITIWVTYLVFFLIVHTALQLHLLGRDPAIATYWPILAGLVILVTGNYLGTIRSNNVAGFRTPWTLSSELSWNKTHRLGGRLLFMTGLVLIAGSLHITGDAWVYFLLGASLLWVVVLAVYSYIIWKRDPDRTQAKLTSSD